MNALLRWGKFNAVGGMGMAVQMGSLWALNRWLPGHSFWASAVAVEMAVVHNFVWHVRYTWRERMGSPWRMAVRFHLANGLVSVVGNVVLIRILYGMWHVPLMVANLLAVGCCSVVNFGLGEGWVFAG